MNFENSIVRLGMVIVVIIANLGHVTYMDTEMREIGYDRKTIREAYVRFIAHRPVIRVE